MADSGTGRLVIRIGADMSGFKAAMKDIQNGLKTALGKDSLNASKELLNGFKLAVVGAGALSLAAIKLGGDIQAVTAKYTYLFGSSKKAKEFVDELEDIALHTKFDFESIDRAANKLTTLGFSADKTSQMMKIFADAATATGMGKDGIEQISDAFAKMSQKATLSEREMKTLAAAGIPAWDILAQKLGVTIPQAMKMAKDGTIKTSDAMKMLLDGMNDKWSAAAKRMSGEVPASLERIGKTAGEILQEFGTQLIDDKGIKEALKGIADAFEGVLNVLKKEGLQAAIEKIFPPWLQVTIVAIAGALMGGMVAALVATAAAAAAVGVTLWPFYVVGLLIAGLAWVILRYWQPVWKYMQIGWIGLKTAASEVLYAIGDGFLNLADLILSGMARAFGWIPGVNDKLTAAKNKIQEMRNVLEGAKCNNLEIMNTELKKVDENAKKATKSMEKIEPAMPGAGAVKPIKDELTGLTELMNNLKKGTENLSESFTDSFVNIIMGTKSATAALKDLATQMGKMLLKNALQMIVSSIIPTAGTGAVGGLSTLGIASHASGGLIRKPTLSTFAELEPEFAVPLSQAGLFAKSVMGTQSTGDVHVETNIINNASDKVQVTQNTDKDATGKVIQNVVIGMLANNTGGFKNLIKAAVR